MSFKHRLIKRIGYYTPDSLAPMGNPDVISGPGQLSNMAEIARQYGCSKPLIVTDEMLVRAGLLKMCTDSLDGAGLSYAVYDKVVPNPHTELVEEGYALYMAEGCNGLIALGGGSPMDACKIIGAMVANPKAIVQYQGFGQVEKKLPPLIAIPTTAGTGSEVSFSAVITVQSQNQKISIADRVLSPTVAVLDPKVLVGLPPEVTAATGMDALTHAVESYLSMWQNKKTAQLSLLAVEKIFKNLSRCLSHGDDLAAREEMLMASFCAAKAFSRASLGYVHGVAHQLGGLFHTPHGVANAMVLPHILECYAERATPVILDKFLELGIAAGLISRYIEYSEEDKHKVMRQFIQSVKDMHAELKLPRAVPGMRKEDVETVVQRALKESHGELVMTDPGFPSPVILGAGDLTKIVAALLPPGEQLAKL